MARPSNTTSVLVFAALVLAAPGLKAGGEYDTFHLGPTLGAAVSLSKEYRGYMAPCPKGSPNEGNLVAINGRGMLAPVLGLEMTWSVIPGRFRLGLDAEFLRPIDKDSSEGLLVNQQKVEQPGHLVTTKVAQNVFRATLKAIFPFATNTQTGWYFWVGPALANVDTSVQVTVDGALQDLPKSTLTLRGGGVGIGRRKIRETRMGIFEINLNYLKDSSSGIQAGGVTLEIKTGIVF